MESIGIVTQNEYPDDADVRTRKIAKTLSKNGYHPVIIARGLLNRPKVEVIGSVTVCRTCEGGGSRRCRAKSVPMPFNPLWAKWIRRCTKENVRLLIARNIAIGPQTALVGKAAKIPIVLDLSENNPAAVIARGKSKFIHHVTRNSKLVSVLEMLCIRSSDRVWVVSEENQKRLVDQGVDGKKIAVVGNTPDLDSRVLQGPSRGLDEKVCRLVYVGLINEFRGLDLVLDALPYVLAKDQGITVLIVGDGEYKKQLERKVKALGLSQYVRFTGWLSPVEVQDVLSRSHIGCIPHKLSQHTNTTIPNKLFDYMAAGLPVITTPMKPVKRIIEEEQCGLVVPSNDPKVLANTILQLKESPELYSQMGKNGSRAIREKYNWQMESEKILNCIKDLLPSKET